MSDHYTECPSCYVEVQVPCTDVAEVERLRAEVSGLKRRMALARERLSWVGFVTAKGRPYKDLLRELLDPDAPMPRARPLSKRGGDE